MPGYTIPCPKVAGKMKTKYFQFESSKLNDVTRRLPTTIRAAPRRTRVMSLPHRDMTMPATRPPMGLASDGIASRPPARVAESNRTTWKNSGRLKRYCS